MNAFPELPAKPLAELLAAVHSSSAETDAPRLALADWLAAQKDPRADIIRIQCAMARLDPRLAHHDDLQRASREWLRNHQAAWLGKIASVSMNCGAGTRVFAPELISAKGQRCLPPRIAAEFPGEDG